MKRLLFITAVFLFIANQGIAQVSESTKVMSQGAHNCLSIHLINADDRMVLKMWKDLMKDYSGKVKKIRKSDDHFTDDIMIAGVSNNSTMDVYIQLSEKGNDTELQVWFDLGGAYLNSDTHPAEFLEAQKFLKNFGLDVERAVVKLELKAEEKEQKKIESELKRLVKKKENLEKDIVRYKDKIAQAEKDIVDNIAGQEAAQKKLEQQKSAVENVAKKLKEIK